jgi:hypothetical protein
MHAQSIASVRLDRRSTPLTEKPRAEEKGELGDRRSVWMVVRGKVLHKKESCRKNMTFGRCDVGGEQLSVFDIEERGCGGLEGMIAQGDSCSVQYGAGMPGRRPDLRQRRPESRR